MRSHWTSRLQNPRARVPVRCGQNPFPHHPSRGPQREGELENCSHLQILEEDDCKLDCPVFENLSLRSSCTQSLARLEKRQERVYQREPNNLHSLPSFREGH